MSGISYKEWNDLLTDKNRPLENRAIHVVAARDLHRRVDTRQRGARDHGTRNGYLRMPVVPEGD